ncbi:MAG: hypothetical protein ABFD54_01660 [Armatimonadota bacterium]|nr:hypothetical protein [bacterium]
MADQLTRTSKADEVRSMMRATGIFSEEELELITDDVISDAEENAVELTDENTTGIYKPASQIWSGNNLIVKNEGGKAVWYWQDKVGSQCGRERWWKYFVRTNDSYAEGGKCPQGGYTWYRLDIMH